jgi:hypothetical protein
MASVSRQSTSSFSVKLVCALVLALLVPVTPGNVSSALAAPPTCDLANLGAGGDGLTEDSAWLISNPDQLWEINDCPGNFFKLTQNIDASTATVSTTSPIGTDGPGITDALVGTLDGAGYEISYSMSVAGGAGLFNQLDGATVKNLTLRGQLTSRPTGQARYSGALAISTVAQVTISNVLVESELSVLSYAGGLIGQVGDGSQVFIENSSFAGNITALGGMPGGDGHVGGFIGRVIGPLDIRNSTSSGGISASSSVGRIGGFFGILEVDPVHLEGLSRTADISGGGDSVGGIFGIISATSQATLSGLTNTGNLNPSGLYTGGIGGFVSGQANLFQVSNSGAIFAGNESGGILGRVNSIANVSISASVNSGSVSASERVGGIVGYSLGNLTITTTHNSGSVTGSSAVGGVLGSQNQASRRLSITSTQNSGSVHAGGSMVGGAIGQAEVLLTSGLISAFTNSGPITATGNNAGGVIGYLKSPFELRESENSASVSALSSGAAGMIGRVDLSASALVSVFNVSNQGDVTSGIDVAGIVGRTIVVGSGSVLSISNSVNQGRIEATGGSGMANIGGLLGHVYSSSATADLQIVQSSNQGEIVAGNRQNVGGLAGFLDSGVSLRVFESYSEGLISGGSAVGGLIGRSNESLSVSNSYSVATLSATSNLGGLVGQSPASSSIFNSYFAGNLVAINSTDGLAFGNSAPIVTSSYTITASTLVPTSSQLELQTQSTYTDWDFNSIWSFGACAANSSYPVLQWSELVYFDRSCLLVQSPTIQAPTSPSIEAAAPAVYEGPIVTPTPVDGKIGSIAIIEGRRLQTVFALESMGVSLQLVAVDDASITVLIPETLEVGLHDLVLYSSYGKLTVMEGLRLVRQPVAEQAFGTLLGYQWTKKFYRNSRQLDNSQEKGVSDSLMGFSSASTVVCWGYTTSENPNAWALAHATQRAEATCNRVSMENPGLKTHVRVRYGAAKYAAMRTSLQFWQQKPAP